MDEIGFPRQGAQNTDSITLCIGLIIGTLGRVAAGPWVSYSVHCFFLYDPYIVENMISYTTNGLTQKGENK